MTLVQGWTRRAAAMGAILLLAMGLVASGAPAARANESYDVYAGIQVTINEASVENESSLYYDFDVTITSFPDIDGKCAAGQCWILVQAGDGVYLPGGIVRTALGATVNFSGYYGLYQHNFSAEEIAQFRVQAILNVGTNPTAIQHKSQIDTIDFGFRSPLASGTVVVNESYVEDGEYFYDLDINVVSAHGTRGDTCGHLDASQNRYCHVELAAVAPDGTRVVFQQAAIWPNVPIAEFKFENLLANRPAYLDWFAAGSRFTVSVHGWQHSRVNGVVSDHRYLELGTVYPLSNPTVGLGYDGEPVEDLPGWLWSWSGPPGADPIPWSSKDYVALGDSFQSGEGTHHFFLNTDIPDRNMCHRSRFAYPYLLHDQGFFGDLGFQFWACSGAETSGVTDINIGTGYGGAWDDPRLATWDSSATGPRNFSALGRLSDDTTVVTIGTGGNDLRLPVRLQDCVIESAENLATFRYFNPLYSCQTKFDEVLRDKTRQMTIDRTWVDLFNRIGTQAPNARIYVFGYPRLFPESGTDGSPCEFIRPSDQVWANRVISRTNDAIEASVAASTARNIQYVDIYDVGDQNELCSSINRWGWFVNPITVDPFGLDEPAYGAEESFHPTALGHGLIAEEFKRQAVKPASGWIGSIRQDQTLTSTFDVPQSGALRAGVEYRGSDIELTLISPSGERYDRSSTEPSVVSDSGPTWDKLAIDGAEPGGWTVELHGAEIDPGGEPFDFQWYVDPLPNEPPVAAATLVQHGATITVDASGSYDPDGTIVEVGFDFGDGHVEYGATATHTYAEGGEVLVTMWVKDDRGEYDFDTVGTIVDIPDYTFGGFTGPNIHNPAPTSAKAGAPIKLRFELEGATGTDVLLAGSPSVQQVLCGTGLPVGDAVAASSVPYHGLKYIPGLDRYEWNWTTAKAWAGTCQRLTFDFNDGDSASHVVSFTR